MIVHRFVHVIVHVIVHRFVHVIVHGIVYVIVHVMSGNDSEICEECETLLNVIDYLNLKYNYKCLSIWTVNLKKTSFL